MFCEKAAIEKKRAEFRKASNIQFGGEPSPDTVNGDVLMEGVRCFSGEAASEKSKEILKKNCECDGLAGVAFDYIGYANFKGCYCEFCLKMYSQYIAENKLSDDKEARNAFYLKQIVDYNNSMVDYINSMRPEFPYKSPERVELELKAILSGGAEQLMLCSLNDVIANPAIAEVFKKYCKGR